jgi:hypothetical protein
MAGCPGSPQSPQGYAKDRPRNDARLRKAGIVAERGLAKVVFARDAESGDSTLTTIVDEDGKLLLFAEPASHFVVTLSPGEHTFYSCAGKNTHALKANLAAGAVYAVEVKRNFWDVAENYLYAFRGGLPTGSKRRASSVRSQRHARRRTASRRATRNFVVTRGTNSSSAHSAKATR